MDDYGELQSLLSESVSEAIDRESIAFDKLAGDLNKSLVLFGAGNLGRKTLIGLRTEGIEPLAFADNNPDLWGHTVEGLQVYPPQEAVRLFGQSAAFVITIWRAGRGHRMTYVIDQLKQMNCHTIIPFTFLFWKYPKQLLPHFIIDLPHLMLEERDDILQACSLWSDDFSRREYMAQIKWRFCSDWNSISDPVAGDQYFLDELCKPIKDEVFIDCGAFNGDTLKTFFDYCSMLFQKYIALEPDPISYDELKHYISSLPKTISAKIEALPYATGRCRETVSFCSTGEPGSCISKTGSKLVDSIPLDELLAGEKPTFIKMDIEGTERDALYGAREIIAKHHPILAICVYHIKNDLWTIPSHIHEITRNYSLFLRPHGYECRETVCYAVPKNK